MVGAGAKLQICDYDSGLKPASQAYKRELVVEQRAATKACNQVISIYTRPVVAGAKQEKELDVGGSRVAVGRRVASHWQRSCGDAQAPQERKVFAG